MATEKLNQKLLNHKFVDLWCYEPSHIFPNLFLKPLMAAEGAYEPPYLATHKLLSPSPVAIFANLLFYSIAQTSLHCICGFLYNSFSPKKFLILPVWL